MGPKNSAAALVLLLQITIPAALRAQDVPGIEICTVEKAMDRRTSCLQSNVEFLQKTMTKLAGDQQQKLDAANRQIEALKATIAGLQKVIADLQAAHKQMTDDMKKLEPAKGAIAPAAKEGAK
jgi:septal ring factor EnvC (AmiA/AmiB activator)